MTLSVFLDGPLLEPARKRRKKSSDTNSETPKEATTTPTRGKKNKKKNTRILKAQERAEIQEVNKATVVLHVQNTVANTLVFSLYPDRQALWESIQDTDGLKGFIYSAVDKYVSLYEVNSKGKDKYANLYLAWLDYIRGFTCWTKTNLGFTCQSCSTFLQ